MAKEFLSQAGLQFEEIDIARDPQAIEEIAARTGGVIATPTIIIDGQVIVGFSRRKLELALGL